MIANGYDALAGQSLWSLRRRGRSFGLPHHNPSFRGGEPKPAYALQDLVAEVVSVRSVDKYQVKLRCFRGKALERAEDIQRKYAAAVGHFHRTQILFN